MAISNNANFDSVFIAICVLNGIVVIGLLFYFPFVFLNFTYTFKYLPVEDIPFYSAGLGTGQSARYHGEWFIDASDVLRIVPPILSLFTMFVILRKEPVSATELQPPSIIFYFFIMVILTIFEFVKMIIRTVDYVYCDDRQFCRNFNPSGDPGSANSVFLTALSFSVIFSVITLVYTILGYAILSSFTGYTIIKKKM